MFVRKSDYDNSLHKVKIEFGTLLGLDKDEDAYITVKEMDTMTTMKMRDISSKGDQTELLEFFKKSLPSLIVKHNLYEDENSLMKPKDVVEFIFEKLDVSLKVLGEYTKNIFRANGAGEDGDKKPEQNGVQESEQS